MARCRWSCCAQKWTLSENLVLFVNALQINTRTYTQIHTPTVVQGRGGRLIEPLLINKTRYILWVVALLEAYHVTNNDRQQWSCQELEIRLKPRVTDIFLVFGHLKKYIKKALCIILSTTFTFIVERCWKNMHFHSKMAWPPATYDVISRNRSSWPSLKLSQNELEG